MKICIDGGFTCPNRDGTKGYGGCIFCSENGSGEHIKFIKCSNGQNFCHNTALTNSASSIADNNTFNSISAQVKNHFKSYKAERANKFIAYFQNFTNTYDTLENLKRKYDAALIDNRIVGLSVATRPDCIDENIAELLKSYADKYYVSVELGLQTANEKTGKIINRCYTNADFTKAVDILNKYNIDVVTHVMVGLPNENEKDIQNTVNFLNKHNIQGIKIHSCYIVKNTKLAEMYDEGKYTPLKLDDYLNCCAYILTHISPDVVIHRVSGDAPKDLLVAPDWNLHKKWIINGLDKLLRERDLWQGMEYEETAT